jgi:hypothetical protein
VPDWNLIDFSLKDLAKNFQTSYSVSLNELNLQSNRLYDSMEKTFYAMADGETTEDKTYIDAASDTSLLLF